MYWELYVNHSGVVIPSGSHFPIICLFILPFALTTCTRWVNWWFAYRGRKHILRRVQMSKNKEKWNTLGYFYKDLYFPSMRFYYWRSIQRQEKTHSLMLQRFFILVLFKQSTAAIEPMAVHIPDSDGPRVENLYTILYLYTFCKLKHVRTHGLAKRN